MTLDEKITVFKSLAISKVIHFLLITKIHNNTNDLLYKYRKTSFGKGKWQKLNIVLFAMAMV